MKIDNDVYIESLYFTEYGYGYPEEVYEYKSKNNKGQINFVFGCAGLSPMVNVKDNSKFSNQIFEIIKTWKHKYYWEYTICDGTLWYLRVRLSNGKYLRFEGHEKYPDNYDRLQGYLNRFVGKYVKQFTEEYRRYAY